MQDNPLHKPKILYVEDDQALIGLYTARLEAEGFVVHNVSDGEAALPAALSFRPDLVLLDIMIPTMSGWDVLDLLRTTTETSATKIIMMSALSQQADIEKAKSLGADDFIIKSQVPLEDIVSRIYRQLQST